MTASFNEEIRRASSAKLERVKQAMAARGSALVAFSGGVDSAFVLAVAAEVLRGRVAALTAHSPAVPQAERVEARAIAAKLGVRHLERESREQDDPGYVANSRDRCYYCKRELFRLCGEVAGELGLAMILDGFNADDLGDHRPGHRAAAELEVRSPLAEAGMRKAEIRAWSEAYGLPTWDKPQMACLASRIPYGTPVTPERLARVERAEVGVRALGFRELRVRHHGALGRVEIGDSELARAFELREEVVRAVKAAGFELVALDLEPFRSGRMNEIRGDEPPSVGDMR